MISKDNYCNETRQLDCDFRSLEGKQVADPKNFQVALLTIQLPTRGVHQRVSDHARHLVIFDERALLARVLAKHNISPPQSVFVKFLVLCVLYQQLLRISV
jgi:hypothetical protein